jgi:hypothetical protein
MLPVGLKANLRNNNTGEEDELQEMEIPDDIRDYSTRELITNKIRQIFLKL